LDCKINEKVAFAKLFLTKEELSSYIYSKFNILISIKQIQTRLNKGILFKEFLFFSHDLFIDIVPSANEYGKDSTFLNESE
jgi:hypothetical protein